MTLTVQQVRAAQPKGKPYKLSDGHGLYLFVLPTGSKSWRANYAELGKQKTRTYGLYPEITLARARELHHAAKGSGTESQPAPKSKPAFSVVAREWLEKHLPSLKNKKHQSQVQGTLDTFVLPKIGARPIDKLERRELVQTVKEVMTDPDRNGGDDRLETAHRVAGRIVAVFDYAQDAGYIQSHQASRLARVLPERRVKAHFPCIKPGAAGELLFKITNYPEAVTRLGLLLAAHTFARTNELRHGNESQLVENGAVWVVPEEIVKGEKEDALPHVIPLSRQVRALVRQAITYSDSGMFLESPKARGRPVSENTLLFALYRLGYRELMTVHGFRTLASTVLNGSGKFHRDVIERQLHHKETDEVRDAYNRAEYLPERRRLMQWWSDWLDHQLAEYSERHADRRSPFDEVDGTRKNQTIRG